MNANSMMSKASYMDARQVYVIVLIIIATPRTTMTDLSCAAGITVNHELHIHQGCGSLLYDSDQYLMSEMSIVALARMIFLQL